MKNKIFLNFFTFFLILLSTIFIVNIVEGRFKPPVCNPDKEIDCGVECCDTATERCLSCGCRPKDGGSCNVITSTNNTSTISNTGNLQFTSPASLISGTEDFCENLILSADNLEQGGSLTLTANAKNDDIKKFTFEFFNLDNIISGKAKAIGFLENNPYIKIVESGVTRKSTSITINFSEFDQKDVNWNYYMSKPKNIWVEVYFTNSAGKISKFDNNCAKKFISKSIDPTPTNNPSCLCSNNLCSNTCFFDKFQGINYSPSIKCSIISGVNYKNNPSVQDQTNWCRYYLLTKGDANGDGKVNFVDYFYFIQIKAGGKVNQTINVDFNGDGLINNDDKTILVKSLKP